MAKANDESGSIKGDRKSHMSVPVNTGAEFHLRLKEIGMKPEQGGKYYVCYPVECVSDYEKGQTANGEDAEMARFRQTGTAHIEPMSGNSDKDAKLKKKIAGMFPGKKPA